MCSSRTYDYCDFATRRAIKFLLLQVWIRVKLDIYEVFFEKVIRKSHSFSCGSGQFGKCTLFATSYEAPVKSVLNLCGEKNGHFRRERQLAAAFGGKLHEDREGEVL